MPTSAANQPQDAARRLLQNPRFNELSPSDQQIIRATASAPAGASHVPPEFHDAYHRAVTAGIVETVPMSGLEKLIAFGGPAILTGIGALAGAGGGGGGAAAAGNIVGNPAFATPLETFPGAAAATAPAAAGTAAKAASAAGAAAGGGGGVMNWIRNGLLGASAVGALTHNPANSGANAALLPQMRAIIDMERQRMQMQNPLYEAVTKMAFNRLPISAQQGLSIPSMNDPTLQAIKSMSGGG